MCSFWVLNELLEPYAKIMMQWESSGLGSFIVLDGVVDTDIYGLYMKWRGFKSSIIAIVVFCFLPSLIYYFKL